MNVVVDACVAVKWYVRESGFEQAGLLLDARANQVDLYGPDLFIVEAVNALAKKVRTGEVSDQQARDAVDHLRFLAIPPVPTSRLLDRALWLAIQLDHALQDCLYLACAEDLDAAFITADDHFLKKLRDFASPARVVRLVDVADFLKTLTSRPI